MLVGDLNVKTHICGMFYDSVCHDMYHNLYKLGGKRYKPKVADLPAEI